MDRINDLTKENKDFVDRITQLNNDVLYRKSILAHWPEAPPELRDAVEVAYYDSVTKADIIKVALDDIINLKSVIDYINETFKSINPSEIQLHIANIDNLLINYSSMKTAFLAKHGRLLTAEFTL
jgi:hypothetical protein